MIPMAWQIPNIPEIHLSERWQIKNPFYWFLIFLGLLLIIGVSIILTWPNNQAMNSNPKFWVLFLGLPTLICLLLFGIQTTIQANQQEKLKAWEQQKQHIEQRWKHWGRQSFDVFQSHFMLPEKISLSDIINHHSEMVGNKVLYLNQDDFGLQQWIEERIPTLQKYITITHVPITIFLLAKNEDEFIEKKEKLISFFMQVTNISSLVFQHWIDGLASINQLIDNNEEKLALFIGWSLNDDDNDESYSEYAFWILGGTYLRQINHKAISCKLMRPITIAQCEANEIKLCIHQLYDTQVKPQSYQLTWNEGLNQEELTLLTQSLIQEDSTFALENQFTLTTYLGPTQQPEGLLLALACANSEKYNLLNSKVNDIWHICSIVPNINHKH